jgi:hypothetical protein
LDLHGVNATRDLKTFVSQRTNWHLAVSKRSGPVSCRRWGKCRFWHQ